MPTAAKAHPHKNVLDIRLAESVVFLRAGDATGRRRGVLADAPPGMVRGLLVLNLAKPTRITSIEIELVGRTTTAWPEGVGARRIEISEEHDIYSQSYVFFRAAHTPGHSFRRHLSVGPGLALEHEDEDQSEQSSIAQHENTPEERRGRSPAPRDSLQNQNWGHRRHMSVDQTHYQRSFVSHHDGAVPSIASPPYSPPYTPVDTPGYLSPTASISHRSPFTVHDESPARSLEDLRRALEAEQLNGYARSPRRSTSSILSPQDYADSRRVSFDEDREFQVGSSTHRSSPSQYRARDGRTPSRQRDVDGEETVRGRKNKRFTFASALFEAMKDRVRSRSPLVEQDHVHQTHSGYTTPPRGRTLDRTLPQLPEIDFPAHKEPSALGRMGEVLGFEVEDGREYGDGWKEFRKGVYTYPISFAIPASAPPSLSVDYGSVTWKLKAVVHRPGAFKTKMTASQDITVVATPGEDDTEDSESIIVERQWDSQMQYLIVISGRSFAIGGTMPISITFMPFTKMKVHRISVIVEERVDYWTGFKRIARSDPNNRITLLALRHPKKDGPAILPLLSDDPDVLRQSPLAEVVDSDLDLGEALSSYMGPGPWTIRKDLQLPKEGNVLHITNKNKQSNISVGHMLKIIFRVERGDDQALDPTTGKRKLFDIVVQTPVHILSHLCNPDHTALPPYSRLPDSSITSVITNRDAGLHVAPVLPLVADLGPSSITHRRSASATPLMHREVYPAPTPRPAHISRPGSFQRLTLDHSSHSHASTDIPASPITTVGSAPLSRRTSYHEHSTPELFERLIAGQESEEGEAPPSYEAVIESSVSESESGSRTPPLATVSEH
ncbi:hypothetical protein BD311DRAFT_148572 [Dichomitus squalens]|uniref:Arrestin C-terminal-like domain-containing protein n=1 Tax=Dichomitus squalens TaxID=114155 RepID=A0A4V2K126_9APHY|nr:hypothetical protein BD311DRAFT_148572 [Dichomitus squalens]